MPESARVTSSSDAISRTKCRRAKSCTASNSAVAGSSGSGNSRNAIIKTSIPDIIPSAKIAIAAWPEPWARAEEP